MSVHSIPAFLIDFLVERKAREHPDWEKLDS